MASKPARDALDQTVDFLSRTSGRDKFCRSVQYACTLMRGYLQHREEQAAAGAAAAVAAAGAVSAAAQLAKEQAPLVETLVKVGSSMSMCRKVLRFGRTAEFYRAIARAPVPETAPEALRLVSKAFLLAYMAFDHAQYFNAVGVVRLAPETAARVKSSTMHSWLGSVVCDLAVGLNDLGHQRRAVRELRADPKATPAERRAAAQRLAKTVRALVRNGLDFVLALDATNRLKLHTLVAGILGLTTSLMGAYEVAVAM